MECRLKHDSVMMQETVYDSSEEKAIDVSMTLPDYCPDIQKILKCIAEPTVTAKSVIGDRFETEGQLLLRLLYLDAEGAVLRSCEKKIPFSSSVMLKKTPEDPVILAEAEVEYLNCRAVSPRKVDIHGAFSVAGRILSTEKQEFVSSIEEEGIEQKIRTVQTANLISSSVRQFTAGEILEIESGKLPAETVVRSSAAAVAEECRIVSEKAVVKGHVEVEILYVASIDATRLEKCTYSIPFSEVLDCAGASEDSLCDIRLRVTEKQLQIRTDSAGENMLFDFEARISAFVNIYGAAELRTVTDAYSLRYEALPERKNMRLFRIADIRQDSFSLKTEIETGNGELTEVIDAWCENPNLRCTVSEGTLRCAGKMTVCLLGADGSGRLWYTERTADAEWTKDLKSPCENAVCELTAAVRKTAGRITGGGKAEIEAELLCTACMKTESGIQAVTALILDEGKPRIKRSGDSLVIYYADRGEKLWNIARDYCTSVKAIQAENSISHEELEQGEMILIPV